jgi:hypothetical protein
MILPHNRESAPDGIFGNDSEASFISIAADKL